MGAVDNKDLSKQRLAKQTRRNCRTTSAAAMPRKFRSPSEGKPKGSRFLIIKESGLKDHDYYGFWGLSPFNNLVSGPSGYCTIELHGCYYKGWNKVG